MEFKTMDGNEACAHIAYMFTELAGIYPITPSSTMAELVDEFSSEGRKNLLGTKVKVVQMQSEGGAAGLIHGSLQAGVLTTTFTASQGLLLMIPNMYKMAGEMLPGVIHVASRSLATHALSILGDHQDIYATRQTGFAIFATSSVQQVMDLSAVSHLSALYGRIPFINFFDGFRTSHELQKIEVIEEDEIMHLFNKEKLREFREDALSPTNKVIRGTSQNEDIYFQATEVRNTFYNELPDTVNMYMEQMSKISGRTYKPFDYYGAPDATRIIVAMGSVCETIRETIDYLNKHDEKVGLIEVHLYRPFSSKYFFNVLPSTVEKIAVLDRTKEAGSNGEPLYLDIVNLFNNKEVTPVIIGGRYGLSSKDTDPKQIKAVYDFLNTNDPFNGFTIGIEDDLTKLSLKTDDFKIENNQYEILIYGYGSDGMVSCSKDMLKTVGNHTQNFVQGYYQYDSKKSGGLTRSHMRISNQKIRSTYFVSNPHVVVCTKDSYLEKYDMVSNIRENGVFVYVTSLSDEDFLRTMPNDVKRVLKIKNIKTFVIDAYGIAKKHGLDDKISMIMELALFKITNLLDDERVLKYMTNHIEKNFSKKGQEIVDANLNALGDVYKAIRLIHLDDRYNNDKKEVPLTNNKVFNMINDLKGDQLKVSDFLEYKDGSYIPATSKFEKRGIAINTPVWLNEKCIECNQCSFVCPHGVIRPYLLNEKEAKNAPTTIKNKLKDYPGTDYKFYIGISDFDCTGCSSCAKTCPAKALEMHPFDHDDNEYHYLRTSVTEKTEQVKNTVKNSQFKTPLFEYSGACAGCGETPYLKLVTQLFGDKMIIANATGCSSIYGASMPSTPWNLPWANSLFEDNAEFGMGILIAGDIMRDRISELMESSKDSVDDVTKDLFDQWLNNKLDYKITRMVYDNLDYKKLPYLAELKEYIISRSIWSIGGDGWAYDIGFSGIDHILASNQNINILVLDTEVYSNTGGQSSKSSQMGSLAKFATEGKKTSKKDLARIALSYKNAYVAQISLGANMQQTINALVEAEKHDGPSIVIAYSPCINHGIKGGLANAVEEEKMAVRSGYFPIFRYNPSLKLFSLDFKEPDFTKFEDFLDNENRYRMQNQKALLEGAKNDAIERFKYYKELSEKAVE